MKKWKSRIRDSISDLPRFVLAWIVTVLALLGGAFAAETAIGNAIEAVLEWIPWSWIPAALLFGLAVSALLDLLWDALPERLVLWSAFFSPAIATAVPGKGGDTVSDWAEKLQSALEDSFVDWFGDQPALGLSIICLIGVLLGAKYALPKSKSKSAGAAGAAA